MRKLAIVGLVVAGCQGGSGPGTPDPEGEVLAEHLAGIVQVTPQVEEIGFQVSHLADTLPVGEVNVNTCTALQQPLWEACTQLGEQSGTYCDAWSTFFMAGDIPRCGVRLTFWPEAEEPVYELPAILAFDVSGEPVVGWIDSCGNGIVEGIETCDDGNHGEWDGCDPNCQIEQFQGCEQVIESRYAAAGVAEVPAAAWAAPRSHIMVHRAAEPLRAVDASLCNEAKAVGYDVCAELTSTMPFVGWCDPQTQFGSDARGSFCAVRLMVGFSTVSRENAVWTTQLPGILSFTLR